MSDPARAEDYAAHRRRLLQSAIPASAAIMFGVLFLAFVIVLASRDARPLGLVLPFVTELALPFGILYLARGPMRDRPETVMLLADQVLTATLVAQLLLPHSSNSGVALAISLKMLTLALFLPWPPRMQLASSAITVLAYWALLAASGRTVATHEFAHQVMGPLLAGILSAAGAARADRMRREVFERDARLADSEAHLGELLATVREAEARKGAIFESVADAIFTIDADGFVVDLNGAAERVFGYARTDALGRLLGDLIVPPGLRERHQRGLAHYGATGQSTILGRRVEMTALRANGTELPVELTVTRVQHDGALLFTGCLRDLTERKRAEERARGQQAELAHALRIATMGEMAAELAHEMNQPLAAIVNFAKGLATRLRSGVPADGSPAARAHDEMVDAAEYIASEALRAAEVMRRQRDFVRRTDGRRERCDLNALVRDAAHLIEVDARRSGVAVRLVLEPSVPPLEVDRIQIEQVVLNLMRNGLEAIAEGAGRSGEENELLIETALNGTDVEVTVRDTGVGLAPAAEQKVFAAFYTTKENGLGLGLSIGKSIVEDHRGRLWAVRNPYRGATFGFSLPVPEPADLARRGRASL